MGEWRLAQALQDEGDLRLAEGRLDDAKTAWRRRLNSRVSSS